LFTSGFDGGESALAKSMDGDGAGELAGEIGKHGLEDFRLDGSGGVEIEVDAVHKASYRILPAGLSYLREVGVRTSPQDRHHRLPLSAKGESSTWEAISS